MRKHLIRIALLTAINSALLGAMPAFADYTVTGRFQYQDREFDTKGFSGAITPRPIRFADVRIVSGDTTLASGATTQEGTFSIVVPGSVSQPIVAVCAATSSTTPGLLLDVRLANDDFTFGDFYSVASAPVNSPGSGTIDMGITTALSTTDAGKVFNIWDVTMDALQFVASSGAHGSLPETKLTVLWRQTHSQTTSFFSFGNSGRFIYVGSTTAFDDTVISHEFGHYIDNLYSKSDSPGGAHYLGDGSQDIRLSWGEGLATFLGSAIRNYNRYGRPDIYVNTDGNQLSFSYEIEALTGSATLTLASLTGSTNEIAVTAALWDITDGPSTPDATPGTDDDPLERPFSDIWKVLTQYLPAVTRPGITIETLWDGWLDPKINNGALKEMQTIFASINGIEFLEDPLESDNTAAMASLVPVAQLPALGSGPKVLINELEMGSVDALELYNAGDREADLTGWTVESSMPGQTTALFTLPAFKLAPGSFVIISEASGTNSKSTLYFKNNISWKNGGGGACALKEAAGTGKDFVRWGDSAEPVPAGTTWNGPNAPSPPNGKTLSRSFDGRDTDAASDWTPQISTFGSWNMSGQERHHTYYPAGDLDYASFRASAGKWYFVETLSLSNGADTILDLISTDGTTVLASNDDFGTIKASRLLWNAAAGGTFYVRSRRFDGRSNFARYGSYELRVIESPNSLSIPLPELLTVSRSGQGGRYERIADAIAAAANGDTIEILDSGTYTETLSISGKSLTLKAASGRNPTLDGRGLFGSSTLSLNAKSLKIDGLTILGNFYGIRVNNGAATIVNSVIRDASDPAGYSDGIQVVGSGSSASIVNCTIVNNRRLGIGVFTNASAKIVNCIFQGNERAGIGGDGTAGSLVVRNSLVQERSMADTNGNISGDAQFVDQANGDFRLTAASPAIDKGDSTDPDLPVTDAEGIPRSLDGGSGKAVPDMGAYEYVSPTALTFTSVFPQIAAGGSSPVYQTSIVAFNTNSVPAAVHVSLTKSDATPFPIAPPGRSEVNVAIPPSGVMRIEAASQGDTNAGYAKLSSNVAVNGSALFKTLRGTTILSEAGVGLSKPAKSFIVYIDNRNNAISGYAIANSGANPANLILTLRSQDGSTRETQRLSLPPGQHIAEFAFQRFTATVVPGFEGTVECSSDQSVAAVALRYDNSEADVFSTIPVLAGEAATALFFPQAADGGGYRTNFILVNPSATPTSAKLEFFDDEGKPMSLPIDGTARFTFELPVSAKGVAHFLTDGTSAGVKAGWVRVTSGVALGGSAIFQRVNGQRILSEAGVSSSPLAPHFTTYVESIGFAQSGLAICNPSSTATNITLILRNASGRSTATVSFSLPPSGHSAKFFSQWFPEGTSQFSGTLEVLATAPVSAVALRYDNPEQNVFATTPVIPIP